MEDPSYTKDVPATPCTHQFHNPPTLYVVENFAIGLENPVDIDALKEFFSNSIMLKIPRFSSLLVRHNNGKHYWRRTRVDIDQHFVIRHPLGPRSELHPGPAIDVINGYLAELASAPPLCTDKPLWEIHVLMHVRCLVLRIHHAIGDGTAIASLIREIGRSENNRSHESDNRERFDSCSNRSSVVKWTWKGQGHFGYFRYIWLSVVFCVKFSSKVFVRDEKTVLNIKDYVDHRWPQKLATARFNLDDVNLVKKAIPNATINDVLCGIIWGGLMKYINAKSSTALREGQRITGLLLADLRRVSGFQDLSTTEESSLESWWGNKFGAFLLPIYYTKRVSDPLDYVREAKCMLDKKKQSAEPRFTLKLRDFLLRFCGVKVSNYVYSRAASNSTFGFSNVVGPSEQISIAGNPVKYLRLSVSSTPLRIVMHLLSYMKNLDLQILVAEEVISDPRILASCFTETLQEMKDSMNDAVKV